MLGVSLTSIIHPGLGVQIGVVLVFQVLLYCIFLQVYDSVGNFSGFVNLTDRIRRPSDIHITQDGGHLLVSNLLGHSVSIFKLIA